MSSELLIGVTKMRKFIIFLIILLLSNIAIANKDCLSKNEYQTKETILIDAYIKSDMNNSGKYSKHELNSITKEAIETVIELSANNPICNNHHNVCNLNRIGEYFTSLNKFIDKRPKTTVSDKHVYLRTYNLLPTTFYLQQC